MASTSLGPNSETTAANEPLLNQAPGPSGISPSKTSAPAHSEYTWLKYAMASFFFAALGQFTMGFMSENIYSRFTLALGNWVFVVFWGFGIFLKFRYSNGRWANIRDSSWIDPDTGRFKSGTFKYLLVSVFARFFYCFIISVAFGYANEAKMNIGIVLSVRSGEALFVALGTYLALGENLSRSKIVGLFILTGGVVGLSLPKGSGDGFSIWAIVWAVAGALISAIRNFAIKALTKQKVDAETINLHAVFWADLLTIIIGLICGIWGYGFNHEFYDKCIHEYTMDLTWRRFWLAVFVGATIYFTLTTSGNANQLGYAGPSVAIKNSALLAVVIMSWLILDQTINLMQWFFIFVLLFGLFVTSAGDAVFKNCGKRKEPPKTLDLEIECKQEGKH